MENGLFIGNYTEAEVQAMPVLALAHIGDGVYELLARQRALKDGVSRVGTLHKRTIRMVSAESQAAVARSIKDALSEEELSVLRRGRNTHAHHAPPHHTQGDTYPMATALEALFGYLYLLGRNDRIGELWNLAERTFAEHE